MPKPKIVIAGFQGWNGLFVIYAPTAPKPSPSWCIWLVPGTATE